MSNFNYLKQAEITASTIKEFSFEGLPFENKLFIAPATEANKPYFNALLKRSRKGIKAVQASKINVDTITSNRNQDRHLYAEFIVKGWEGIVEVVDGKSVPSEFSREKCLEFLNAIPTHWFDDLRNFASLPDNFSEVMDPEETGKN